MNNMNSDISEFMHKIGTIIEAKSINEVKDFLMNQILALASKLSHLESELGKMKVVLEAKDDLIGEYQKVIKDSTVKINQMKSHNNKVAQDKQRQETDFLLMALNDIKSEVESIEGNYNEAINDKNSQISQLNEKINSIILEKNDMIQTINDYHVVSEREKEELNQRIIGLIREIEAFKGTQAHDERLHQKRRYNY